MGRILNRVKNKFNSNKNEDKQNENFFKKYLKRHLKKIIVLIIVFIVFLVILLDYFDLFSDTSKSENGDSNGSSNGMLSTSLTLSGKGLFKIKVIDNDSKSDEIYAVLDENVFRQNINTKGFSKKGSYIDNFENENDHLNGEYSDNVKTSKTDEEKKMREYGILKELIIKIAASGCPEDVKFVVNKTLVFDDEEDPSDEELINTKLEKIINENDTITINGGVCLYRNGSTKIKYIANTNKLDNAYYTIENGYIKVPYKESLVTNEEGKDTFNTKLFDLTPLVEPYITDFKFISGLNTRIHSENFLYYLSLLISESHIDVGIYENTTYSTLTLSEKTKCEIYKKVNSNNNTQDEYELEGTEIFDNSRNPQVQKETVVNLKIYVMNVENWVATIHNKIIEVEGNEQEIYNDKFNDKTYRDFLKNLEKFENKSSAVKELKQKIEEKINSLYNISYEGDKKIVPIEFLEEKVYLKSKTIEYKYDQDNSIMQDNTDYFCGLIRNSTSKGAFSKEVYNNNQNRKELNTYTTKIPVSKLIGGSLSSSGEKNYEKYFHKFDKDGKSMLYVKTGYTTLVCPDSILSNEDRRKEFLVISNGRYDETINLIWDKLCGKTDSSTTIKDIAFRELETEDINETYINLKSFIKSMEGTKKIVQKNNTYYHETYMDSVGIPTTAWGINLYEAYEDFEHYLGDVVYTPAFYSNGFLIPDNIIELAFDKYVSRKVDIITKEINKQIKSNYYLKDNERDSLVYVSWWYGNYGGADNYANCISEALSKSERENWKDRKKIFAYYDHLKNNVHTAFNFNSSGAKPVQLPIFLLYSHGLYYRRGGELFAANTQPIQYALELYKKFVDEGYEYDESAGFYQTNGNADDSGKYGKAQYNDENKLTINDYEYVTWVFYDKNVNILSRTYSNYDSFIKETQDKNGDDYNKFEIVDNTGENGVPKTIKSRDDLLPGDIVIVQEGERKSIKIYGGRSNWIEMDKDTLEELKEVEKKKKSEETKIEAKRESDDISPLWKLVTPIANYKGDQSGAESSNVYGKQIDINSILWVYRNKALANNYIYNDSGEYTNYKIENHMLTRISSNDPNGTTINSI